MKSRSRLFFAANLFANNILQVLRARLSDGLLSPAKAGDSEVVVIESRPTVPLFDSEEGLPYSQYVRLLRMLFQRHTEQFLIELRCAVNIGTRTVTWFRLMACIPDWLGAAARQ
jgi:hypothetical protein